jgi:hypothetical protein
MVRRRCFPPCHHQRWDGAPNRRRDSRLGYNWRDFVNWHGFLCSRSSSSALLLAWVSSWAARRGDQEGNCRRLTPARGGGHVKCALINAVAGSRREGCEMLVDELPHLVVNSVLGRRSGRLWRDNLDGSPYRLSSLFPSAVLAFAVKCSDAAHRTPVLCRMVAQRRPADGFCAVQRLAQLAAMTASQASEGGLYDWRPILSKNVRLRFCR